MLITPGVQQQNEHLFHFTIASPSLKFVRERKQSFFLIERVRRSFVLIRNDVSVFGCLKIERRRRNEESRKCCKPVVCEDSKPASAVTSLKLSSTDPLLTCPAPASTSPLLTHYIGQTPTDFGCVSDFKTTRDGRETPPMVSQKNTHTLKQKRTELNGPSSCHSWSEETRQRK